MLAAIAKSVQNGSLRGLSLFSRKRAAMVNLGYSAGGMFQQSRAQIHPMSGVDMPKQRPVNIESFGRLQHQRRLDSDTAIHDEEESRVVNGFEEVAVRDVATHPVTFRDVKIREVLEHKAKYGSAFHAVHANDHISSVVAVIRMYDLGAVLVRDEAKEGEIVGIVSTRDYLNHVSEGADPLKGLVKEYMTPAPVYVFSDEEAIACLELMVRHNFRHLPVRDRCTCKVIGLVSIHDLVRNLVAQYRESHEYMYDFISGKYY